jgi:hypothetical protein
MPWYGIPQGLTSPPPPLQVSEDGSAIEPPEFGWMGPAPGTVILVFVFLAAFVTYYFVNWKMLSFVWQMG